MRRRFTYCPLRPPSTLPRPDPSSAPWFWPGAGKTAGPCRGPVPNNNGRVPRPRPRLSLNRTHARAYQRPRFLARGSSRTGGSRGARGSGDGGRGGNDARATYAAFLFVPPPPPPDQTCTRGDVVHNREQPRRNAFHFPRLRLVIGRTGADRTPRRRKRDAGKGERTGAEEAMTTGLCCPNGRPATRHHAHVREAVNAQRVTLTRLD